MFLVELVLFLEVMEAMREALHESSHPGVDPYLLLDCVFVDHHQGKGFDGANIGAAVL